LGSKAATARKVTLANSSFNNSLIPLKILKSLLEEAFKRYLLFAIAWLNALDWKFWVFKE
jgi:hypothetical protein